MMLDMSSNSKIEENVHFLYAKPMISNTGKGWCPRAGQQLLSKEDVNVNVNWISLKTVQTVHPRISYYLINDY